MYGRNAVARVARPLQEVVALGDAADRRARGRRPAPRAHGARIRRAPARSASRRTAAPARPSSQPCSGRLPVTNGPLSSSLPATTARSLNGKFVVHDARRRGGLLRRRPTLSPRARAASAPRRAPWSWSPAAARRSAAPRRGRRAPRRTRPPAARRLRRDTRRARVDCSAWNVRRASSAVRAAAPPDPGSSRRTCRACPAQRRLRNNRQRLREVRRRLRASPPTRTRRGAASGSCARLGREPQLRQVERQARMVGRRERPTGAAGSCARGTGLIVSSATVEATRNVGLVTDIGVLELCGCRRREVKRPKHDNSKRLSHLTARQRWPYNGGVRSRVLPDERFPTVGATRLRRG